MGFNSAFKGLILSELFSPHMFLPFLLYFPTNSVVCETVCLSQNFLVCRDTKCCVVPFLLTKRISSYVTHLRSILYNFFYTQDIILTPDSFHVG